MKKIIGIPLEAIFYTFSKKSYSVLHTYLSQEIDNIPISQKSNEEYAIINIKKLDELINEFKK